MHHEHQHIRGILGVPHLPPCRCEWPRTVWSSGMWLLRHRAFLSTWPQLVAPSPKLMALGCPLGGLSLLCWPWRALGGPDLDLGCKEVSIQGGRPRVPGEQRACTWPGMAFGLCVLASQEPRESRLLNAWCPARTAALTSMTSTHFWPT